MRRHPLDPFSLLAGLLFVGLGIGFLLDALDVVTFDVTWVPATILIVLGAGAVLSGVTRARRTGPDPELP